MGNQANICIKQEYGKGPKKVFFYTHWYGKSLPFILQKALNRGQRWDDDSYLARIIFSEMLNAQRTSNEKTIAKDPGLAKYTGGDVLSEQETGFGISTEEIDPNRLLLTVDVPNQKVKILSHTWTFSEYTKLTKSQINKVYLSKQGLQG